MLPHRHGQPAATPGDQAGGSGYLVWIVMGFVVVIVLVAGGYFLWFFRK